ncbi:MAG: DsrE/DsrF/DrsH-like family protein [Candidatus Anammoxibacter sp.]
MHKTLIIGGVAGGATAAARLRRNDEDSEIIVFERGSYVSYANCGLPYYIGGEIEERDRLFVQTPEGFRKRYNIEVRIESEVLSIDREGKQIEVKNLRTSEVYKESYDKLVLSPGAEPIRPPIPGINEENIFTLRNVDDTDHIKEFIDKHKPEKAIVVGGGFIGLEMAENLHRKGIVVAIVEMLDQVMAPIDFEMAAIVHDHIKLKNVGLYFEDGVSSFQKDKSKLVVKLKSGRELVGDMVLLSIGVRPETKLAKDAGLEIGERGGITVNEFLQTTDPDIYALGDAIEFDSPILNTKQTAYLAGPANKQARIVADNITDGNKKRYKGAICTAIARVFDLSVAVTGVSAKILKREEIPFISSITHSSSHAGYYPGATSMTINILFSKEDGKLFGGQIVGYKGVDKRIDLIASVIKSGGTIYDLQEIEHAYAPPYSSAKDPVNIAGFAAENILTGKAKVVHWYDVAKIDKATTMLVDVRTKVEHELGTIDGAVNIPVDELRARLSEIPAEKKIVLFCGVGLRGYVALRILAQKGYANVYNLSGGYKTYKFASMKQRNEDVFDNNVSSANNHNVSTKKGSDINMKEIDACGLQCPGPIMKLKSEVEKLASGNMIKLVASDPGFFSDVKSWCNMTGNKLVSLEQENDKIIAVIEKTSDCAVREPDAVAGTNKTIVVFSSELDKALASFVIANGAVATGKKVTMFFTFWGLNVIRRPDAVETKKDFMGKMFGRMLPRGSKKLKLSKLNMAGMGTIMMKLRMKSRNISSLEELINMAQDNGVEFIACQMSMDLMGIKEEELIDGIKIGGVATYLEEAEKSNVNLFI